MNDENIRSALQDAIEAKIPPTSVRLWPSVKTNLAAGTNQRGKKMNTVQKQLTFTALAVSVALVVVLATPQGQALAQRMVQFFNITEEKSFPLPTEHILPAPETPTPGPGYILPVEPVPSKQAKPTTIPETNCNAPESQDNYFCKVTEVETEAGFDAKEFLHDPKGLTFSTASFNPSTGELTMEFGANGGTLYLRQGVSDFPDAQSPWGKVPADAVEQVSVNGLYAEIVLGMFAVYPNATEAVWEPGGRLSLAWRDGDHWFVLDKLGDPYPIEWITKEELVKLAEGLVDERPVGTVPPLDPERLSTEQAEALAGFDIPTPAMLPAGYEIKQIGWVDHTVRLAYGPQDSSQSELFLFLGQPGNGQSDPGGPCTTCPADVTETVQVGGWQGWYWRGSFEMSAPTNEGQPTPAPTWVGNAPHWSLMWNSDVLWFSIFYSPAYGSGREANKEMLVKIAESVK